MRIGIEAQRIFRKKKHGMDMVALETIRTLQRIDKHNEYVVFSKEGEDMACLEPEGHVKVINLVGSYPVWEQIHLPREAKQLGLDLLHCTSNTAPVRYRKPMAVTVHDIIYFERNPLFAPGYTAYQRFGNMYRRSVVKRIIRQAELIITVSEFERNNMLNRFPFLEDKLHVVYNGVGRHFEPILDNILLEKVKNTYKLPDHFVLFLGNTDPKKNSENVIVAFAAAMKQSGLDHSLVVGDFDRSIVASYLEKAGLKDFIQRIHFPGYINNADMPAIFSLADFYLYPSKRESFGIPILEAMACGTAVITSNTTSMPEVGGGAALYADPFSRDDLADKMIQMATDEKLKKDLVSKGLERAKMFSWEASISNLLTLYQRFKP
jgi:glycosyltransferase involved in cell wall biosynthesis